MMNRPQQIVNVHFVREWRIRRPYVYRYLEKEYVDKFFEDGTLRLSSFSAFKKHKDEQRGDPLEGLGLVIHRNGEGEGQTFWAVMKNGHDAYVLCGSILSAAVLGESFGANSGFRINDTTGFADAVSRHIAGFAFGTEGLCHYADGRTVKRDFGRIDFSKFAASEDQQSWDQQKVFSAIREMAGDDVYFLKDVRFANQSEYRMLWFTSGVVPDYIEIRCPEARQFCTRFEDLYVHGNA
jgi:hypothetical protein